MTATVTTKRHSSSPRHTRRNLAAAFAGAAIVASTLLVVNRVNESDSPRVANRPTNESTLGVTEMYGAFWAYTPESTLDLTIMNGAFHASNTPDVARAVSTYHGQFVVKEALSEACANGHPDACQFAHTWVPAPATPLQGIEVAVAGVTLSNPAPAIPLQGIEIAVVGLR